MTDDELREALKALGSTPEEVADRLRKAGIKGKTASSRNCPIARYFRQWDPSITVGYSTIGGRDDGQAVTVPSAVRSFIGAFDRGKFPDLRLP